MVKTPPCSQYEPPRNILYSRNGKKFCRISQEGNPKGPKIPPCDQYGENYIIYKKNNKKFCRKSNKKNKVNNGKTLKKGKCSNMSNIKLKKFANLLNINISKYSDKEWICNSMNNLFNTSIPDISDIKYLCQLFKIKTNKKRESLLCNEIRIKSMKNKDFNDIVSIINYQNIEGEELDYLVSNILLSTLYPYNFPHHSPIPISEELYSGLIQKKINNNFLTNDEEDLLNNCLYIKLCHCTRKLFLKSKFVKDMFNKESTNNNYAICTDSVYNNRGLKIPKNAFTNCQKNFKWCRDLGYLKKQKGGSNSCEFENIGPVPPNKEIIKNNNITDCFNSFETHTPPKWPNIYACPSKKCNYWAGGKRKNMKGGYDKQCNYFFYEGKEDDRINILKDGQIGDTVEYITNNQEGYSIYEIVEGDEKDGKTLELIGDIEGIYRDNVSGGKISLKRNNKKNKKSKKGGRINKCNLNNEDIINVTNNSLENYARPSNSGKYNQLDYASKIAQNFQNGNNNNWNPWMKNHDNYWW